MGSQAAIEASLAINHEVGMECLAIEAPLRMDSDRRAVPAMVKAAHLRTTQIINNRLPCRYACKLMEPKPQPHRFPQAPLHAN